MAQKETEKKRGRDSQTERDRERQTETEKKRGRDSQTERDRERQRQRYRERKGRREG